MKSVVVGILLLAYVVDGADEYDYIVVGAGSAGSAVSSKLAKAGHSVLLIEAGPDDDWTGETSHGRRIDPRLPNNTRDMLFAEEVDDFVVSQPIWQFDRAFPDYPPFAKLKSKNVEFMPRARIVGGCSMHNNMIWLRPSPQVFDSWGEKWSWETLRPKYYTMEHNLNPNVNKSYHGSSGPCYASNLQQFAPESDKAFVAAAIKAGYPANDDFNGATLLGAGGWPTSTTAEGMRWSSSFAFLTPEIRALPNFRLLTESMVTKILFNGTRATGVSVTSRGRPLVVKARKEVILSAGAFRSPQLLMLSGIGPSDVLANHKIPTVVSKPGVGKNLQDHGMVTVAFPVLKPGAAYDDHPDIRFNFAPQGVFYYSSWCREQGCTYPDMQIECGGGRAIAGSVGFNYSVNRTQGCVVSLSGHVKSSPGYLTLKSKDPKDYPAIYPNYLGAQEDVERLLESIKVVRNITAQDPEMFGPSLNPPANWTSDELLKIAVQMSTTTNYHPVGTCKMGPLTDPMAVVDPDLKVIGAQGLRVVDASIMPLITNCNTDQTSRLIGFHIADVILEGDKVSAIV